MPPGHGRDLGGLTGSISRMPRDKDHQKRRRDDVPPFGHQVYHGDRRRFGRNGYRGSERKGPGGPLPDRWNDYGRCRKWIETCNSTSAISGLLPCKTFLDPVFDDRASLEWHPTRIDERIKLVSPSTKPVKVGAVINLCLTERHYRPADFMDQGIDYYWFKVSGGGEEPSLEQLCSFCDLLMYIGIKAPSCGVVVHCTHGINRTGMFVCFYLCVVGGMSPEAALLAFEDSRGHAMERENLLALVKSLPSIMLTPPIVRLKTPLIGRANLVLSPLEEDVREEEVYLIIAQILQGRGVVHTVQFEDTYSSKAAKVFCLLREHQELFLLSNKDYKFDNRPTPFQVYIQDDVVVR